MPAGRDGRALIRKVSQTPKLAGIAVSGPLARRGPLAAPSPRTMSLVTFRATALYFRFYAVFRARSPEGNCRRRPVGKTGGHPPYLRLHHESSSLGQVSNPLSPRRITESACYAARESAVCFARAFLESLISISNQREESFSFRILRHDGLFMTTAPRYVARFIIHVPCHRGKTTNDEHVELSRSWLSREFNIE